MLPPTIEPLIKAAVAEGSHENDVPENDVAARCARRHGGIPLLADMFTVYFLRPDGSIWGVDDSESDDSVAAVVPANQQLRLLAAGARRYPWLAELLPKTPADATLCPDCRGEGVWHPGPVRQAHGGVFCPSCDALGWRPADQHGPRSPLAQRLSGR